jgi:hypothetical protein
MRKTVAIIIALFAIGHSYAAVAADGIECVAADLTQDTMEQMGAADATQYTENPVIAEPGRVDEFNSILAACAKQWGWSDVATQLVSDYSKGYLGTRYAFNILSSKKAFAIEPFYNFIEQMDDAEVQTALTKQIFAEQRKTAFIALVVGAMGETATQDDVTLFHGFLMAQLKKDNAEKRLKAM